MNILEKLSDFLNNGDAELMEQVGHYSVNQILTRTEQGKDYTNTAFKPYSASYKKIRQEAELPTDKADLFFWGKMLNSLSYRLDSSKKVKIAFFADREQSMKAIFNNKRREFFNLNDDDKVEIRKMIAERMAEILNEL